MTTMPPGGDEGEFEELTPEEEFGDYGSETGGDSDSGSDEEREAWDDADLED